MHYEIDSMAYKKKYATRAELSAALSAAAKSRQNNRGGRPKGSKNKGPSRRVPTRTLTVREQDYDVFTTCARAALVPLVDFMHMNAGALKRRNPTLFAEDAPAVQA